MKILTKDNRMLTPVSFGEVGESPKGSEKVTCLTETGVKVVISAHDIDCFIGYYVIPPIVI